MITDKLTRHLRDLRISVTDKCNFRCGYCMPAEIYGEQYEFLPKAQMLTFEEISRLVKLFVELGTKKLRLTGGEPLVRNSIENLVAMLCQIEGVDDLTLTTNGFLLAEKAQALENAGLQRITVSLDSLDDQVFAHMNGRNFTTARIMAGIHKAEQVGLRPIKINTVVQRNVNEHTLIDLARHFKGTGHIIRFIEYMDVGNRNGWRMNQVVSGDEIVEIINKEFPIEPIKPNYKGEVALRYRYIDGSGEIGVITSVTNPFCGNCTRARLSTDGKLYTCLFAKDGFDLRGPVREGASDEELRDLIIGVWHRRSDRYSEERTALSAAGIQTRKVEMYQIGG